MLKKKLFSALLVLAMVISLMSIAAPSALASGETYSTISTGAKHTMAVKKDGSLWAWGINENGQLGDGTVQTRLFPVKVMEDVALVSAGGSYTISSSLREHVLIAYKYGLISGYPDGSFGAQRPITRAEAASLLVRVLYSNATKIPMG